MTSVCLASGPSEGKQLLRILLADRLRMGSSAGERDIMVQNGVTKI